MKEVKVDKPKPIKIKAPTVKVAEAKRIKVKLPTPIKSPKTDEKVVSMSIRPSKNVDPSIKVKKPKFK